MPNIPSEMDALLSTGFKNMLSDATYGTPQKPLDGVYTFPVQQNGKYLVAAAAAAVMSGITTMIWTIHISSYFEKL
jgi:hypothetical protein